MGAFDDREMLEVAKEEVGRLEARVTYLTNELESLHSWDGLMDLLDEHWPASMIPTREDEETRDTGPRIVSLLRWVGKVTAERDAALTQSRRDIATLAHVVVERDRMAVVVERIQHIQDETECSEHEDSFWADWYQGRSERVDKLLAAYRKAGN